ncbi:hypothetical protein HD806DRAFT_16482 [Xylariaceae sp. AK1471]|nr:hypothetical protein HD806DRAFT_16482 [Xylariaceae sp. AK1471]
MTTGLKLIGSCSIALPISASHPVASRWRKGGLFRGRADKGTTQIANVKLAMFRPALTRGFSKAVSGLTCQPICTRHLSFVLVNHPQSTTSRRWAPYATVTQGYLDYCLVKHRHKAFNMCR